MDTKKKEMDDKKELISEVSKEIVKDIRKSDIKSNIKKANNKINREIISDEIDKGIKEDIDKRKKKDSNIDILQGMKQEINKVNARKEIDKEKNVLKNDDKSDVINKPKKEVTNSKVTDIKEVQKAAQKKEREKRFIEKKEHIKEKIEIVKTPKFRVIIITMGILIAFGVFVGLTMIKEIQVDEGKHYTEDEIKDLVITNVFDYNTVYLFLRNRYTEQDPIPFLEYIDVRWIDKNTIKLKVYDKNIIGCTSYMNEYVYFDKDGYVVETSQKKEEEIAFITGIDFEEMTLNEKMKVQDDEIFDTILSITQQITKYKFEKELEIDEINFDEERNLTLYSGNIKVLLGKQETYDEQLAKLNSMLKEAKKEKLEGVLHMENYKEGQDRMIFDKKN